MTLLHQVWGKYVARNVWLRTYWFYSISLLHTPLDLSMALIYILIIAEGGQRRSHIVVLGLQTAFWALSFIHGMFLTTYGFLFTHTRIGIFVFQQLVYCSVIAITPVLTVRNRVWFKVIQPNSKPSGEEVALISCSLHFVASATLWWRFLAARRAGDLSLSRWTVDVGDLATGTRLLPSQVTWRGTRRRKDSNWRHVPALGAIWRLFVNMLFRRVHPVETRLYAFSQHVFALAALALLITRAVTLITQLDNEELPSRALVEPCGRDEIYGGSSSFQVFVLHPKQRGLSSHRQLTDPDIQSPYQVTIALQAEDLQETNTTFPSSKNICDAKLIHTDPNTLSASGGTIDWFWVYSCDNTSAYPTSNDRYGFKYFITTTRTNGVASAQDMPSIWLVNEAESANMLTPYLTPPLRPALRTHTVFETYYARRRFISSSALRDAITGSKPTYNTTKLYPPSQLYSQPSNNTNVTIHSSGFIRWPVFMESSSQISRSSLKEGTRGPENLCQVTEEYRVGSTFDILASIGGLLALLQGLHIFLFGRPLFWGLFGTKLLTPFGLMGRFATGGFRQRLRDHYHIPQTVYDLAVERPTTRSLHDMQITQFLLDYVLDMGPASPPGQERRGSDSESPDKEVELGSLDMYLRPLSRESSMMQSETFLPYIEKSHI